MSNATLIMLAFVLFGVGKVVLVFILAFAFDSAEKELEAERIEKVVRKLDGERNR